MVYYRMAVSTFDDSGSDVIKQDEGQQDLPKVNENDLDHLLPHLILPATETRPVAVGADASVGWSCLDDRTILKVNFCKMQMLIRTKA
jgi:hypothetical protein